MFIPNSDALVNVRFFVHTVLNEAKSKAAARPIFDEIEACETSFAANKQTIGVFGAHDEWGFKEEATEYGVVKTKMTYAMRFNEKYLEFKSGDAQSLGGTSLEELTFLTVGKRLELKALKIHTAETLAALDGSALKMLGQGGRDLKNQAIAYLETAQKTATVAGVKEALSERDDKIAVLEKMVAELSGKPTANKVGRPAKAKTSEFETFENTDILNWLNDNKPDHGLTEHSTRDQLLAVADTLIDERKQKKAA